MSAIGNNLSSLTSSEITVKTDNLELPWVKLRISARIATATVPYVVEHSTVYAKPYSSGLCHGRWWNTVKCYYLTFDLLHNSAP